VRFCEECGGRLVTSCASCGAELLPDKKFCGSCGSPVTLEPLERQPAPQGYTPKHLAEKILTSRHALEGERKQVTVLFADLKGSMELLADQDPEEARRLLDPVLERMMEAVHRYEGTVNQVMGDGIMALFGAPLAHEDHAVRACHAALRMQQTVGWYAEELRRGRGVDVQIRVGLNSGEVVVRAIDSDLHMDYSAIGQTTHLAARMEQLARPGSTLVSRETLRLAEGYIEVKPLGPVPVKGMPEPVEIFELLRTEQVHSRLEASAARGLTPFVGREPEVETLHQAMARAAAGHGQIVAVSGEPGVGKSRLFWEFTHSHRAHGWLMLEAQATSYGKNTSYLTVKELLQSYFQLEERDDPRRVREKVTGKLLTLDESLRPTLPAFLQLLDVPVDDAEWQTPDLPQRRQRMLDAVKRLILREGQVQPVIAVFENLHWLDSESQAFLDSLVDSLPLARALILVSYRPEYQHGWARKSYYTQFRIDPLPPQSAEELLRALVGDDPGLGSRSLPPHPGSPEGPGTRHRPGGAGRAHRSPAHRGQAAAAGGRGHRQGRVAGAAAGDRRPVGGGDAPQPGPAPGRRVPVRDQPLPERGVHVPPRADPRGGLLEPAPGPAAGPARARGDRHGAALRRPAARALRATGPPRGAR
jgi:class 3 adenylate cyclase